MIRRILKAVPRRLSALARKTFSDEAFLDTDESCRRYQESAFARQGLDYALARRRLDAALKEMDAPPFNEGEDSQHWALFAGLAAAGREVKKILEIGTFDGSCTRILAALFPEADIVTVDLRDDDPRVARSYGRGDRAVLESVVAKRKKNLKSDRIAFVQENSFFLPKLVSGERDLIWIDGDHTFPAMAWDFCNAYHLLGKGGFLACDDVYLHPPAGATVQAQPKAMLDYLKSAGIFDVDHILKRVSAGNSSDPAFRKYIGVLRHPAV